MVTLLLYLKSSGTVNNRKRKDSGKCNWKDNGELNNSGGVNNRKQGQVIKAQPGARGTTTTDHTLHQQAKEAARKARFCIKTDAPKEQTGSITYNFIRQI